jgi:hypothetical protein
MTKSWPFESRFPVKSGTMVNRDSTVQDPYSIVRACSASCTKAGVTALFSSIVAVALLPNLRHIGAVTALTTHALARINLKTAVDGPEADRCWQLHKALDPDTGTRTLAEVRARTCFLYGPSRLTYFLLFQIEAHLLRTNPTGRNPIFCISNATAT